MITVVEELWRRLPVINSNLGELGGHIMLKLVKKMVYYCISWVLKQIASFLFLKHLYFLAAE